eukprot:COSAG06_NODE_2394_length_6958_cov_4.596151_11_plen_93_part_00
MVVLVCSSKEQPLVFCVQRCCAASVMGLALDMLQLVEKTRDWRGFKDELGMLAASSRGLPSSETRTSKIAPDLKMPLHQQVPHPMGYISLDN